MDIQLKELLEKIKNEGVASAQEQASALLAQAEKNAAGILAQASAKADSLIADAKQKASVLEASSRESLKQAARDLLLSVDQDLSKKFNALLSKATAMALDADTVKKAVEKIISSWAPGSVADLSVTVDPAILEKIRDGLTQSLADEIKKGLQIQAGAGGSGFKVMQKDGSAYFEFSAGSLTEVLSTFLNPKLADILKGV
jgi:V/A-type H+-transporting ATPase subunit E